jgi:molybdopterin/thiamine biosynthesis adenylyltransferase
MTIQPVNAADVLESRTRFKDADWLVEPLSIIIGGAGGIGSWVSLFLSRIGHELHIYDMDTFESHNMSGQFVDNSCIGLNKAEAVKKMCEDFNQEETLTIHTHSEYTLDSPDNPIVFSCFDNMAARRIMFTKWVELLKANPEIRKEAIFIDGRLLAEQFQIFTIQGDDIKAIKKYFSYLFNDDEIEEAICTFKQTSHIASMIGGNMISVFNNWVTNKVLDIQLRNVPFFYEQYTPIFYSQMDMT